MSVLHQNKINWKDEDDIRNFRIKCQIPDDVQIRGPFDDERDYEGGWYRWPLVAITEGGVRFPIDYLIQDFLHYTQLLATQVAANSWKILGGIISLNEVASVKLTLAELFYCYDIRVTNVGSAKWNLQSRPNRTLIHCLPITAKNLEKAGILVRGNWEADTKGMRPIAYKAATELGSAFKKDQLESRASLNQVTAALEYFGDELTTPCGRTAPLLLCYMPTHSRFRSTPGISEAECAEFFKNFDYKAYCHRLKKNCCVESCIPIEGIEEPKLVVNRTPMPSTKKRKFKKQKCKAPIVEQADSTTEVQVIDPREVSHDFTCSNRTSGLNQVGPARCKPQPLLEPYSLTSWKVNEAENTMTWTIPYPSDTSMYGCTPAPMYLGEASILPHDREYMEGKSWSAACLDASRYNMLGMQMNAQVMKRGWEMEKELKQLKEQMRQMELNKDEEKKERDRAILAARKEQQAVTKAVLQKQLDTLLEEEKNRYSGLGWGRCLQGTKTEEGTRLWKVKSVTWPSENGPFYDIKGLLITSCLPTDDDTDDETGDEDG